MYKMKYIVIELISTPIIIDIWIKVFYMIFKLLEAALVNILPVASNIGLVIC